MSSAPGVTIKGTHRVSFKARLLAELIKMMNSAASGLPDIAKADVLAFLESEIGTYGPIAKHQGLTPLQGARFLIRSVALDWSSSGKLERLSEVDSQAYALFKELFEFSENERVYMSEEEFWAKIRTPMPRSKA
jgi:hypothetical protein